MEFDWDPTKNEQNIRLHHVDFDVAAAIFEHDVLTTIDDRRNYGEVRFVSIGIVKDDCYVVVWTWRDRARRIISAWKGGRDERRTFRAVYPG